MALHKIKRKYNPGLFTDAIPLKNKTLNKIIK